MHAARSPEMAVLQESLRRGWRTSDGEQFPDPVADAVMSFLPGDTYVWFFTHPSPRGIVWTDLGFVAASYGTIVVVCADVEMAKGMLDVIVMGPMIPGALGLKFLLEAIGRSSWAVARRDPLRRETKLMPGALVLLYS